MLAQHILRAGEMGHAYDHDLAQREIEGRAGVAQDGVQLRDDDLRGDVVKFVQFRDRKGRRITTDVPVADPGNDVTLTIDHRVVDGHQTNAWLSRFVEIIEGWPAA